ncbi:MAG: fatty acid desaturase [Chromatiales bacterium]|jgi:stearoyl-CoA desaturase (delta-9 desaturase)|nr:fatty acid desaturase [Chromatiales bacterium]MDH3931013.1 fatty acid desaturase [Chromatiales bacterium]MDH3945344.1 fatty acid desaturase [Chromatiales bacterium]MDH4015269.1 fatty acid desaturase [Chromatiales bacterium]
MQFLYDHMYGLIDLSFWGYVIISLVMLQVTVTGVTLYFHRDQAHRGVDLHPVLRHFFRFWLWMGTGMTTREWVAVHRKHHAKCETAEDPHSPVVFGLKKVLLEGAELYKEHAADPETLEKYSRGCPDDWLENQLYYRHSYLGILIFVVAMLLMFGVAGVIMVAVQMSSMPLLAAGVINGIGHHSGYRNFETEDAATNIVPWGVFLGGEELHNNHHAFPSSAKFSMRSWEFDIGWMWLTIFSSIGLARVKKVAPKLKFEDEREQIDLETVRAVIVNRMHILREYTRNVTLPVFRNELNRDGLTRRARRLLIRRPQLLDEASRQRLRALLAKNPKLATVVEFRERLQALWEGRHVSNERLIAQLKEWCAQAEASGIKVLQDYARALKHYTVAPA